MLAGPEAAIKMTTTRRAARRMTLGSGRLPNDPLRGDRPPGAFDGDCLGGGIPGGDDGCNGSPGDGPPAASAGWMQPRPAKSPVEAIPVSSAATIPWAFSAATTSSGARVRLGVDLSEWPPFPCAYAMMPGSCTTYLDHEGP